MLPHLRKKIGERKNKFAGGKPFNPLTFDVANLLALYSGDVGVVFNLPNLVQTWADQSANGYNLTMFNNPLRIVNAINGHAAVRFDGINQYGQNNAHAIANPTTFYIVFNQITNTFDDIIMCASNLNSMLCRQRVSPNIDLYNNASLVLTNAMGINSYDVLTYTYDGLNSVTRRNNNAANTGDSGNGAGQVGWNLACRNLLNSFANIEVAYLIIRSAADNTATQNLFINWLKNRFAL